jgi:hypothetical protein
MSTSVRAICGYGRAITFQIYTGSRFGIGALPLVAVERAAQWSRQSGSQNAVQSGHNLHLGCKDVSSLFSGEHRESLWSVVLGLSTDARDATS